MKSSISELFGRIKPNNHIKKHTGHKTSCHQYIVEFEKFKSTKEKEYKHKILKQSAVDYSKKYVS